MSVRVDKFDDFFEWSLAQRPFTDWQLPRFRIAAATVQSRALDTLRRPQTENVGLLSPHVIKQRLHKIILIELVV